MLTLKEIGRRIQFEVESGRKLPRFLLGDLLDDFRIRAKTPEAKLSLVSEEPEQVTGAGLWHINAYLAALAEALCREAGLEPPQWISKPAYFLERPYFAGELESVKALLIGESPAVFRKRNLFVSADAMKRV